MTSVRIVLDDANSIWILGKMALRLADELRSEGWDVSIADEPSVEADVNHWMSYMHPWTRYLGEPGYFRSDFRLPGAVHTVLITHIDDALKLRSLREVMGRFADRGICLSSMTAAKLADWGVPSGKLRVAVPATDAAAKPRRTVLGFTTRLYPDGRKREHVLVDAARRLDLSPFRFEIFGRGWESVLPVLQHAGADVAYDAGTEDAIADYRRIEERLPFFDYYVYLGEDEGSMGFLDALAAGVKTIVTPQGFHLDVPGGITHAVRSADDLVAVLSLIAQETRTRADSVRGRTWAAYAAEHAELWRELLESRAAGGSVAPKARLTAGERWRLWRAAPRGDAWHPFWRSVRYVIRARFSEVKRKVRSVRA
jgi:hypothetical protein